VQLLEPALSLYFPLAQSSQPVAPVLLE
jgi:hypothetical protein